MEMGICERLRRLTDMYLAGELAREEFERELRFQGLNPTSLSEPSDPRALEGHRGISSRYPTRRGTLSLVSAQS